MSLSGEFKIDPQVFGVERNDPGWIYVFRNNELIKVGKTTNPTQRISQAKTWLPALKVVGVKPFWNVSETERLIHEGLTQFWYDREWFSFGSDEFGDVFISDFREFHDDDRDANSVNFIYWFNSSGMAELVIERRDQDVSLRKWLREQSYNKRS